MGFSRDNLLVRNRHVQVFLSEMLGSFVLMTLVDMGGGLATVMRASGVANFVPAVAMSNGLGIMAGVCVSFRASGGHVNPAVSLAMFSLRKLSALHMLLYQLAQYIGCFLGGLVVFLLYHEMLNDIDGGTRSVSGSNSTLGVFVTAPHPSVSVGVAFADQVVGTGLLLLVIRAVTDPRNLGEPGPLQPIVIGLAATGIIASEAIITGSCYNPARDFGPRMAAAVVGYGGGAFSANDYYFWVPLVGPYVGALVGSWLYEIVVALPLEQRDEELEKGDEEPSRGVVNVAFTRNVAAE